MLFSIVLVFMVVLVVLGIFLIWVSTRMYNEENQLFNERMAMLDDEIEGLEQELVRLHGKNKATI